MSFTSKSTIVLLLLANISLQVISFVFVKFAALDSVDYISLFLSLFYVAGLTAVVVRAVVWQLILKRVELSKAYPLNAVVPVLILVASIYFFHESISRYNVLGALLIVPGILLLVKEEQTC
jgi:drug/metabolite transporter (DMT)-like permease